MFGECRSISVPISSPFQKSNSLMAVFFAVLLRRIVYKQDMISHSGRPISCMCCRLPYHKLPTKRSYVAVNYMYATISIDYGQKLQSLEYRHLPKLDQAGQNDAQRNTTADKTPSTLCNCTYKHLSRNV